MVELPDDVIKSLVEAASGIDIVPELLARVPEAVEYVDAWRKTLIANGSLREESPTNEFLGVLTVVATWIANRSIAARVRAEAVAGERQRALAVINAAIQGEMDLHQCSFDELPEANKRFVQGLRRAHERVAAGSVPVATQPHADYCGLAAHSSCSVSGCNCWCHSASPSPPDEHERQHLEYGTWPCAWHGSAECPIVEELASLAQTKSNTKDN